MKIVHDYFSGEFISLARDCARVRDNSSVPYHLTTYEKWDSSTILNHTYRGLELAYRLLNQKNTEGGNVSLDLSEMDSR